MAADLLVEAVTNDPELMKLLQEINADELSAIADALPLGFASRLISDRETEA